MNNKHLYINMSHNLKKVRRTAIFIQIPYINK